LVNSARRIRIISAAGIIVIARSDHCCTDNAYAHAAAHIRSAIGATTISATRMDASDANTARATYAAIRQSIRRNTRDAQDGSSGNGKYSSIRHEVSSLRLISWR
jgi:hypothetical protein